jgi:hypothetical protein
MVRDRGSRRNHLARRTFPHRRSFMRESSKRILARANLNECCLLLTSHSTYSHGRRKCHSSFRDFSAQLHRDDYGCGRVRRDCHTKLKALTINLPARSNFAIERLIGRGGEGQLSCWLWLENSLSIPRRTRRNARDDLVEPVADSPIGIVIQRVMWVAFLIDAIPGFPDRRCSFFDGIQPGGRCVLHEQGIGEIEMVVVP